MITPCTTPEFANQAKEPLMIATYRPSHPQLRSARKPGLPKSPDNIGQQPGGETEREGGRHAWRIVAAMFDRERLVTGTRG